MEHYFRIIFLFMLFVFLAGSIVFTVHYRKTKAYEKRLTPEQRMRLAAAKTTFGSGEKPGFYTEGLIMKLTEKKEKVFVQVIFHNRGAQDYQYNKISLISIPSTKEEVALHGLKVGDYVRFYTNVYEKTEVKPSITMLSGPLGAFTGGMAESLKDKRSYLVFQNDSEVS